MPLPFWHCLPNFVHRMSFFNPAPRHPKTSQDPKIPRYPKPVQQISQLRHIRVCLASSRCILPSHRMGQRRRRRRRRRMLEAGTSTVAVFESKMQSGSESENLFTTKCIRMPVCFTGVVFVAASLLGTRLWNSVRYHRNCRRITTQLIPAFWLYFTDFTVTMMDDDGR